MRMEHQRYTPGSIDAVPPGDCMKTSIACCLDLEWEEVPHFAWYNEHADEDSSNRLLWWYALVGWAWSVGLKVEYIRAEEDDFPERLESATHALMDGKSPRGDWGHCVVVKPEYWDPHPSGRGLEDVWGITVFEPLSHASDDGPGRMPT